MAGEVNDLGARLAKAAAARDAGDVAGAIRLYRAAAETYPQAAEPHHHLAGLHLREGRLAEAEAEYRQTLALAPDAGPTKRVLAILLLSLGRFEEGFALFEARHELAAMKKPPLPWPEWRGEDLAGKRVLIWPEQGFGDQIQFARFAPVLKARGAEVILICDGPLARLFAGSLSVQVIAASGAVEFPDPDYWIMAGSTAWRLGVTVETIPNAPYLRALEAWRDLGPGFKAGLAWRGSPAHANDANRSLPEIEARRLMQAGVTMIDLDPAATGARDFADTAAIMAELDLVVAVDTAAAHLAGAMGKPCWVLLPSVDTDWRWLRGRTDSPWYPSMRLYRQAAGEGWGPTADQVIADLRALAGL